MYKDPLLSRKSNKIAEVCIEQETAKKVTTLENPDATDACFLNVLHDLCVLNRMKDSHDTN